MLQFTEQQFKDAKEKGEQLYKAINDAFCPYFKEKISFGALGLEHLKFKRHGKARSEKDQYMRFKLIHLVPEVLNLSYTLQGISEEKKFERIRVNNRTDTVLVPVNYYEFISVIKRNRVRIIIKQIDDGQKFFWSLIPFWKMNEETKNRILHDGFPEED